MVYCSCSCSCFVSISNTFPVVYLYASSGLPAYIYRAGKQQKKKHVIIISDFSCLHQLSTRKSRLRSNPPTPATASNLRKCRDLMSAWLNFSRRHGKPSHFAIVLWFDTSDFLDATQNQLTFFVLVLVRFRCLKMIYSSLHGHKSKNWETSNIQ